VHGATDQEIMAKLRGALEDHARSLYQTFQSFPHFILPRLADHWNSTYASTMTVFPVGNVQLKMHNRLFYIIITSKDSMPYVPFQNLSNSRTGQVDDLSHLGNSGLGWGLHPSKSRMYPKPECLSEKSS
jgi:hypothetical protein